jgi:uroporphyrinogen-III synthase
MEMPISGKTIVITRDVKQAKPFAEQLKNLGANVLLFPTIKISPPDDPDQIRKTLTDLSAFEWIIFTSSNAVRYFFKFINEKQNALQKIKIACVGNKTSEALEGFHLTPMIIPDIYTSHDLLDAILKQDVKGKRILLPVSNLAGNELQEGLKIHGALVEQLVVYKNVPNTNSKNELIFEKIGNHRIDCITFFSPSAVNTFADLIGEKGISLINTRKIKIAVIGSTTAFAARENKLIPEIMPAKSNEDSFVVELERYFNIQERS